MVTIGIGGATGRFGRAILTEIERSGDIDVRRVVASRDGIAIPEFPALQTESTWAGCPPVQVILDVSVPEGTRRALAYAVEARTPFITGVTGLSDDDVEAIEIASTVIPVLAAANFSIGVAALLSLLPKFARSLPGYDVSLIDVHHRSKRDSPSGTARLIVDALNQGRMLDERIRIDDVVSIRAGGIPGQHAIAFTSMGEEIRIEHRALSRTSFAEGALAVARWMARQRPGRYGMADVVA
jgi:4-hydroxy-tetrahydrodipicolinate reductase